MWKEQADTKAELQTTGHPNTSQAPHLVIRPELIVNKAQVSNIILCIYHYKVSILHKLAILK